MKLDLSERGGWVGNGVLVCTCTVSGPGGKSTANNRSQEGQGAGGGERLFGCCLFVCLLTLSKQNNQTNRLLGGGKTFASLCRRKLGHFQCFFLDSG